MLPETSSKRIQNLPIKLRLIQHSFGFLPLLAVAIVVVLVKSTTTSLSTVIVVIIAILVILLSMLFRRWSLVVLGQSLVMRLSLHMQVHLVRVVRVHIAEFALQHPVRDRAVRIGRSSAPERSTNTYSKIKFNIDH